MKAFFQRIALAVVSLAISSLPCFAGSLDDYYLQQFGELPVTALQKAILMPTSGFEEQAHCGTPLKHGLQRDWGQLQAATQKTLAKQLALPVLSNEATLLSSGGHFLIRYATTGPDAPTPGAGFTTSTWVQKVADTFEEAFEYYRAQGYHLPPTLPAGAPYDIYLRDLAGLKIYGQTTSDKSAPSSGFSNAFTSFVEIDNDFTEDIYTKTSSHGGVPLFTPLNSLRITAAHEFHHAIQYSYNIFFDVWYAEATSSWFEDELFDIVNQSYNYIPTWFNNSTQPLDTAVNNGGGYSRWIFNRHLAEKHGVAIVRKVWEKLAGLPSPGNNADIPMVPVIDSVLSTSSPPSSFSNEFFSFTKRVYTRDWKKDSNLTPAYRPVSIYTTYPVDSSVSLPHYSFAYYKFTPSATTVTLTISLAKTNGIQAAVFKNVGGTISPITADTGGASFTVSGFNTLNSTVDEVVLLIANTTDVDGHNANFSTDGTGVPVSEPTGGSVYQPATPAAAPAGGGGFCFIATAAYGSYLHPQVQVLRDFRDQYLLTNAPGRAFVTVYYRLSPPVAEFLNRHETLRLLVRLLLTPIIFVIVNPGIVCLSVGTLLGGGCLLYIRRRQRLILTAKI